MHAWGYKVEDQKYKSAEELLTLIARAASKGSNLLLNIGPQPDGNLPKASLDRLAAIGKWMDIYGESIYGTSATGIPEQSWGVTTRKDNIIYMHLTQSLKGCHVIQLPLAEKVRSVTLDETSATANHVIAVELKQ